MKTLLRSIFWILLAATIVVMGWYAFHNDIIFSSDIARDFFLLQEIAIKKIVLIGPRSSVSGLFHGPVWLYLNVPAFLIGHGNPVAVGINWVVLSLIFVAGCFFMARQLFGSLTAYIFTLFAALYVSFHANGMYNPHGAMFMLPFFFYFFVRYFHTRELKYLLAHVVCGGLMIQFEMAVGIPFVLLSFLAVLVPIIKYRKFVHVLSFALIPLLLSNFIFFDLRHQHILLKGVLRYISPQSYDVKWNTASLIKQRLDLMTGGAEIIRTDPGGYNRIAFIILMIFMLLQIKQNRYRVVYVSFLYFYFGYFLLSFVNRGALLYFYLFPLFPWILLIVASTITSKYRYVAAVGLLIVYVLNVQSALNQVKDLSEFSGKNDDSWQLYHHIAEQTYRSIPENHFGYFVYSPDAVGYQPKYAMQYTAKEFPEKKGDNLTKEAVTYLVISHPPRNDPFMTENFWIVNQAHISAQPVMTEKLPGDYKLEKYVLSDEEQKIPYDPAMDPGLSFR